MATGVLQTDITPLREETLQNLKTVLSGCSMMHSSVTVHVDFKRGKSSLKQNPNDLDVALVTGPVHRGVFTDLLSILWLYEGIIITVLINVLVLTLVVLLVYVAGVSVMLNQ